MVVNLPAWLGIIVGVLTIVTFAATAFAVFMSTYYKSRNELKDRMIDDYKERNSQLEGDVTRKDAEILVEKNARIALEKIVVGYDELKKIQELITTHDKNTTKAIDSVKVLVQRVNS